MTRRTKTRLAYTWFAAQSAAAIVFWYVYLPEAGAYILGMLAMFTCAALVLGGGAWLISVTCEYMYALLRILRSEVIADRQRYGR